MRQVLLNYVSNALKFTPSGGRVTVHAHFAEGSTFRLEVEDTGMGIAAQDIGRLFQDFHQLDGGLSKEVQGTGLGLALTKRLVEAQGGKVGVVSQSGQGQPVLCGLAVLRRLDSNRAEAPSPGCRANSAAGVFRNRAAGRRSFLKQRRRLILQRRPPKRQR